MNNVKFIRGLWGDGEGIYQYIPQSHSTNQKISPEIYVFGKDNYAYLSGLGYSCIKVSDSHCIYDNDLEHKLHICTLAINKNSCPIIFIDWHVALVRELDDTFYLGIGGIQSSVQAALDKSGSEICTWRQEDKSIASVFDFVYFKDTVTISEISKVWKNMNLPKSPDKALTRYLDSLTWKWRGVDYYKKYFEIPFYQTDSTKEIYGCSKDMVYFESIKDKLTSVSGKFYKLPDSFENCTSTF